MGLLNTLLGKTQVPSISVSILPEVARQAILQGKLPRLNTNNIFLKTGEYCCYIDKTILMVNKTKKIYQHKVWTLHESYTKDHFAPFGARPSSFQKNHQFP